MDKNMINKDTAIAQVAETGKVLLEEGLVARTWGNISSRIDENTFVITPSGLDYTHMTPADITTVDMTTMEWTGKRKPSSEKGVHQASYLEHSNVNFVIHTHQTYATAIGITGIENLQITQEERERLGGIAVAKYGLPGTKKLTQNVRAALASGAKVVLMAHHGALIGGVDREDAMEKVRLLEKVCQRNTKVNLERECKKEDITELQKELQEKYPCIKIAQNPATMQMIKLGGMKAQLDDMAQMIGRNLNVTAREHIDEALNKMDVVLVPQVGAIIKANDEDDVEAMEMLVEKAAVSYLHTKALGVKGCLPLLDTVLMRLVYTQKYSKQKEG